MSEALQALADRVADGKSDPLVLAVLTDHAQRLAALETADELAAVDAPTEEV